GQHSSSRGHPQPRLCQRPQQQPLFRQTHQPRFSVQERKSTRGASSALVGRTGSQKSATLPLIISSTRSTSQHSPNSSERGSGIYSLRRAGRRRHTLSVDNRHSSAIPSNAYLIDSATLDPLNPGCGSLSAGVSSSASFSAISHLSEAGTLSNEPQSRVRRGGSAPEGQVSRLATKRPSQNGSASLLLTRQWAPAADQATTRPAGAETLDHKVSLRPERKLKKGIHPGPQNHNLVEKVCEGPDDCGSEKGSVEVKGTYCELFEREQEWKNEAREEEINDHENTLDQQTSFGDTEGRSLSADRPRAFTQAAWLRASDVPSELSPEERQRVQAVFGDEDTVAGLIAEHRVRKYLLFLTFFDCTIALLKCRQ
ncbi:unnamed protein product, partial [Protopolystoma xenopodis]